MFQIVFWRHHSERKRTPLLERSKRPRHICSWTNINTFSLYLFFILHAHKTHEWYLGHVWLMPHHLKQKLSHLHVVCFLFVFVYWNSFNIVVTILIAKISATKRYNNAEMGHPNRIPLDITQFFKSQPLFFIVNIGFV